MNTVSELASKTAYSMEDLLQIMEVLRSPSGCSWDREQNHLSIRRDFLEECYEVIEAIDKESPVMLREELGDVLLNIVFHCRIEEEKNSFNFGDVVSDVAAKMVQRHPHVFSDIKADTTEAVLQNWDVIKRDTKGQQTDKDALRSVSPALPALMRCQKVLKKAEKYGLPVPDLFDFADEGSIGALLASVVALAQSKGIDSEEALARWTSDYIETV